MSTWGSICLKPQSRLLLMSFPSLPGVIMVRGLNKHIPRAIGCGGSLDNNC